MSRSGKLKALLAQIVRQIHERSEMAHGSGLLLAIGIRESEVADRNAFCYTGQSFAAGQNRCYARFKTQGRPKNRAALSRNAGVLGPT